MRAPGSRCGRIVGEAQRLGKFIVGVTPDTGINPFIDPMFETVPSLIDGSKGVPLGCWTTLKGPDKTRP